MLSLLYGRSSSAEGKGWRRTTESHPWAALGSGEEMLRPERASGGSARPNTTNGHSAGAGRETVVRKEIKSATRRHPKENEAHEAVRKQIQLLYPLQQLLKMFLIFTFKLIWFWQTDADQ